MTHLTIPEGYALTVVSWENDADNYLKETIYGLSAKEVRAYLNLCKPFVSSWKGEGLIGNIYEAEEYGVGQVLYKIYVENPELQDGGPVLTGNEDLEDPEENENFDYVVDHMQTKAFNLGLMERFDFYTRVFASFKVAYYKVDVYAEDATEEFK